MEGRVVLSCSGSGQVAVGSWVASPAVAGAGCEGRLGAGRQVGWTVKPGRGYQAVPRSVGRRQTGGVRFGMLLGRPAWGARRVGDAAEALEDGDGACIAWREFRAVP